MWSLPPVQAQDSVAVPAPETEATAGDADRGGAVVVADEGGSATFEIDAELGRSILDLQADWEGWVQSTASGEVEASQAALERLRVRLRLLRAESAPELGAAAAYLATRLAAEGNDGAARLAVDAAEVLAPSLPDAAFADAVVLRAEGQTLQGMGRYALACLRLLRDDQLRLLSLANLTLGVIAVVVCLVGLFGFLQLAGKGNQILAGVRARFAELPLLARAFLSVLVLVWPLALPGGLLWAGVYWCVLFWRRQTASERGVAAALLVALVVLPFVVDQLDRVLRAQLFSARGVVDSIEREEFRASLPQDLELLLQNSSDSTAVRQLAAEVHGGWGQSARATELYKTLLEEEPGNPGALLGMANFAFLQEDFLGAIDGYKKADAAGAPVAETHYNLSQAYSSTYAFDQAERSLERARGADEDQVADWIRSQEVDRIVPESFALTRRGEIVAAGESEATRRVFGLPLALHAVLSLALVLVAGFGLGGWLGVVEGTVLGEVRGWMRFLSPGLAASQDGAGFAALAAIVPVALLIVLLGSGVEYWFLPVVLGPGSAWRIGLSAAVAIVWIPFRARWLL